MKTTKTNLRLAAALVAAGALSGCYAELEDQSVTLERAMPVCDSGANTCAFAGVPSAIAVSTPVPFVLPNGVGLFTIDLGEDVFKAEHDLGPTKMTAKLIVNSVTVASLTAGATFGGIEHLELQQVPAGCVLDCAATTIATYDRAPSAAGASSTVLLKGVGANLLELADSGKVTVRLVASGALPTVDWSGTVKLDGALSAKATYP